jgi:hypothetical protein
VSTRALFAGTQSIASGVLGDLSVTPFELFAY